MIEFERERQKERGRESDKGLVRDQPRPHIPWDLNFPNLRHFIISGQNVFLRKSVQFLLTALCAHFVSLPGMIDHLITA